MMAPQIGPHGLQETSISRAGVLASTEATKNLHTTACKLTTYPFVQHVSLANRDKGHLQAREAQSSMMLKET